MAEGIMKSIELEGKLLKLPEECRCARFYDICDLGGRILHKIDAIGNLEIDLSFLEQGKYVLWTVCEGNALQFHFSVK